MQPTSITPTIHAAFLSKLRNAAQDHQVKRDVFPTADRVSLLWPRDEPDWAPRLLEMLNFCEAHFPSRWRYFAPMSSDMVTFEFGDSRHAVHFKLRWG